MQLGFLLIRLKSISSFFIKKEANVEHNANYNLILLKLSNSTYMSWQLT